MRKAPELPDHMFRLIEGVQRRLGRELTADLREPRPRPSFVRLVQMIPDEGIRITDLAALSGMTKQSLGELVDAMERQGLVTSGRRPSDRRVRLVTRTETGTTLARTVSERIAAVEAVWRAEVGARRYDTMKAVLRELGAAEFTATELT